MHIRDFQRLMKDLYFKKDKRRGIERTYIWLVEEVGELGRAILKGDVSEAGSEAADVLAWLLSLCNLLGIDLERVSTSKYHGVCPRCHNIPCICEEPLG